MNVGQVQVPKLMREEGWVETQTESETHHAPRSLSSCRANLFNREFTAQEPNRKWGIDVRHVGTDEIPAQAGEGESTAPLGRGLT